MWILPKNYQPSSAFVADTVGSKEDLTLLGSNIESCVMWRSKPSSLPTWLRRWSRVSWLRHLFTRILKPSQHTYFETALTSSLAAIRASRFQQPENDKAKKTPGTSGLTSESTSTQLDLFDVSSKTSKDTSRWDSPVSSATWKKMVTKRRGEYSQRLKSGPPTRESESSLWPTPVTTDHKVNGYPGDLRRETIQLGAMVHVWPTPTVQDSNKATKKLREDHQNNLTSLVFNQEKFPTPTSRDWKDGYRTESLIRKDGKSRARDLLPNAAIGGLGSEQVPGHLNPTWVEWLMGVPTEWTDLGSWGTE